MKRLKYLFMLLVVTIMLSFSTNAKAADLSVFEDIPTYSSDTDIEISPTGFTKTLIDGSSSKDTKKPTVKGVKNNKTYKKAVTIKVYDKSGIKKVTLNQKKVKVSKAKKGYKVSKNGKYTLCVWDKAGNKRVVKFKIKK